MDYLEWMLLAFFVSIGWYSGSSLVARLFWKMQITPGGADIEFSDAIVEQMEADQEDEEDQGE